jgi:hypothetical protein
MPWRYVSRSELLENLQKGERGATGIQELREWLRDIMVDSDLELDDTAAPLIHASAERLDVASDATVGQLAGDLRRLIIAVAEDEVAKQLIPVVEERERVAEVLEKVGDGRISRTAFLSFITERRWPTLVKDCIAGMNKTGMRELELALTLRAYEKLPALLSMP